MRPVSARHHARSCLSRSIHEFALDLRSNLFFALDQQIWIIWEIYLLNHDWYLLTYSAANLCSTSEGIWYSHSIEEFEFESTAKLGQMVPMIGTRLRIPPLEPWRWHWMDTNGPKKLCVFFPIRSLFWRNRSNPWKSCNLDSNQMEFFVRYLD